METLTDEQKLARKKELQRIRQKKYYNEHRTEILARDKKYNEYRKIKNKEIYQAGREFRQLQKMVAEGKAEIFFDCQV